jgi:hypothetical protein
MRARIPRKRPWALKQQASPASGRSPASKQAAPKADPARPRGLVAAGPVFGLDGAIQAKLTVNQPGDHFEQEADAVAEQVTAGRTASAISARFAGGPGGAQRQGDEERAPEEEMPEEEAPAQRQVQRQAAVEAPLEEPEETVEAPEENVEEEEQPVQAKAQPGSTGRATIASSLQGLQGRWQPLPGAVRAAFEPRFGRDFSHRPEAACPQGVP